MGSIEFLKNAVLIKQGAEAKIYRGPLHTSVLPDIPSVNVIFKHRFPKSYRHSTLDSMLTRGRVSAEARTLVRCLRAGVSVPGVRMVDEARGMIALEEVHGRTVREILGGSEQDEHYEEQPDEEIDVQKEFGVTIEEVMLLIGRQLARMHAASIIHGDLTTSNMILRRREFQSSHLSATIGSSTSPPELPAEIVLIDFGLTSTSSIPEDKAVDLYVLERAFSSTHPSPDEGSHPNNPNAHPLFEMILKAYGEVTGSAWDATRRRLDEVRLRGRKRSMVG